MILNYEPENWLSPLMRGHARGHPLNLTCLDGTESVQYRLYFIARRFWGHWVQSAAWKHNFHLLAIATLALHANTFPDHG